MPAFGSASPSTGPRADRALNARVTAAADRNPIGSSGDRFKA
jgi:hypothetical protein